MKKGKNIVQMGNDIDRVLEEFKTELPSEVNMFRITDQAQVVGDSVNAFLRELVIAIVAVVIVVMLLLPLRVALVAASTIPITIFISLGLFYAFGIELNTVTLAALIVTLGMIVDKLYCHHRQLSRENRRGNVALACVYLQCHTFLQIHILGYTGHQYHILPLPDCDSRHDTRLPAEFPLVYYADSGHLLAGSHAAGTVHAVLVHP